MISFGDITSFDVVLLVLFVFFTVRGAWIGFMKQVPLVIGLLLSYLLAGEYAGQAGRIVAGFLENRLAVFFLLFGLLWFPVYLGVVLVGKALRAVMEVTMKKWFDRCLGSALGALKAIFVVSLLSMGISAAFISGNEMVKKSWSLNHLAKCVSVVKNMIGDTGVRALFVPKEPAIKPDMEFRKAAPEKARKEN